MYRSNGPNTGSNPGGGRRVKKKLMLNKSFIHSCQIKNQSGKIVAFGVYRKVIILPFLNNCKGISGGGQIFVTSFKNDQRLLPLTYGTKSSSGKSSISSSSLFMFRVFGSCPFVLLCFLFSIWLTFSGDFFGENLTHFSFLNNEIVEIGILSSIAPSEFGGCQKHPAYSLDLHILGIIMQLSPKSENCYSGGIKYVWQ